MPPEYVRAIRSAASRRSKRASSSSARRLASRPGTPLILACRMIRAYQRDQDVFDQAAADYLGLNRTDLRCLDILDQHGPMTAGRLAAEARLTTGAVTTVLDRLEQAGYVRRTRDTVDRRRVLVETTPLVRERGAAIWGPMAAATSLDRYSDEQLALLLDFVRHARRFLAEQLERVRSLPPPPWKREQA
jgi:DNA-binding MarR family transcriptional regulator